MGWVKRVMDRQAEEQVLQCLGTPWELYGKPNELACARALVWTSEVNLIGMGEGGEVIEHLFHVCNKTIL